MNLINERRQPFIATGALLGLAMSIPSLEATPVKDVATGNRAAYREGSMERLLADRTAVVGCHGNWIERVSWEIG